MESEVQVQQASESVKLISGLEIDESVAVSMEIVEEELKWSRARIEMLETQMQMLAKDVGETTRFVTIARAVGEWKARTCAYNDKGICRAWRVGDDLANDPRLSPLIEKVNGVYRFRIDRDPTICALCPLYRAKK